MGSLPDKRSALYDFEVQRGTGVISLPSTRAVIKFMAITVISLAVLSFAASVWMHYQGLRFNRTLFSLLDLDDEGNLPTWYSSLSLAFCAVLLFLISAARRIERDLMANYWLGLACVFTVLSFDELASIHERAGEAFIKLAPAGLIPNYGWVVLALPLLIVFGVLYVKFLLSIPRGVAKRIVVAGSVFVSGALLTEVFGQVYGQESGYKLMYYAFANIEELLEMVGIILFVRALLYYMRDSGLRVNVTIPLRARSNVEMLKPMARTGRS